jgi:hypothetical protein
MFETIERLVGRLQIEGEKTRQFFQELLPEDFEKLLYADGQPWTVRQVLGHFVTTEQAIYRLIESILSGSAGVAEDFDIDAYNARSLVSLHQIAVGELLEKFSEHRQAIIRLVEQMNPLDLQKTGRHPFLGLAPVEDMIKLLYRHNQIHQRDIRKLLSNDGG